MINPNAFLKKKVLFASVLKPVDDLRLYGKIGKSLEEFYPDWEFFFIGNQVQNKQKNFFTWGKIQRLSLIRFFFGFFFLKKLLQVKADYLFVGAIELLPFAFFYKLLHKKLKIIYDIQENYQANILYNRGYPNFLRKFLVFFTRKIENLSPQFVNHFLLAEKSYANELKFIGNKYTLVENKFLMKHCIYPKTKRKQNLGVFSGTISETYGIYEALNFAKLYQKQVPDFQLVIIGFAAQKKIQKLLKNISKKHDFIQTIGIEQTVAHQEILNYLQKAEVAILPYQINQSIEQKIPTKFYECLSLQTPMLIQKNKYWKSFFTRYSFKSSIFYDFQEAKENSIFQVKEDLQKSIFYENYSPQKEWFWEYEKEKLRKIMNAI